MRITLRIDKLIIVVLCGWSASFPDWNVSFALFEACFYEWWIDIADVLDLLMEGYHCAVVRLRCSVSVIKYYFREQ